MTKYPGYTVESAATERSTRSPQDRGRRLNSSILRQCILCCIVLSFPPISMTAAVEMTNLPSIKAISPLGVVDGMVVSLTIRGFNLTEVTELRFPELKTAPVFKIKSKGAAQRVARISPDKVGDTQIEVELLLPVDTPAGSTTFIVSGPNGKSEPRKLTILDSRKSLAEQEPNDGFSEAQDFTIGQTITGAISGNPSKDIFGFQGEAGQRVKIEVQAAQLGSILDPFLLIHNAEGQTLMEVNDGPSGLDPVLEFTLPKTGHYYISIRDAKDSSGPLHAYLIRTRVQ